MTPEAVRWLAVAVLIVVACYTDLTTQKIRNWLTFPTMLLGTCAAFYGLGAWWLGAAGVAVRSRPPCFRGGRARSRRGT